MSLCHNIRGVPQELPSLSLQNTQNNKQNKMYMPLDVRLFLITLHTQHIEHITC
jgi:hypothetical protein